MACKIALGNAFPCDALVQPGVGGYVYLINKEDFDGYQLLTFDVTTDEITALTLLLGTQGYKFEAPKGGVNIIPSVNARVVTGVNGYDHMLDIRAFNTSQLSRNEIKKLSFQKVVAIVPLADGRFELYGRRVGLRMSSFVYNPADADVGGTLQFVLNTPDTDSPELDGAHLIASTFDITTLDSVSV